MEKLNPIAPILRIIFFVLISFTQIFSQDFSLGGYTKVLFNYNQLNSENKSNLFFHSRANLKYFFNEKINLNAAIRNRIVFGESPNLVLGYSGNEFSKDELLKLDYKIWDKTKSINHIEVDRLYTNFQFEKFDLTIGRQRIAWGTSWVWNITDLFNPLSVLDFDYEERPAVDALRIQFYPFSLSKFDLAIRPSKQKENSTALIQFYTNLMEYDFFLLGGIHKNRFALGYSFSGDIYGAGFRGEVLYLKNPTNIKADFFTDLKNEKKDQLSFVLSLDYTFENSLYLHSEVLYNNIGKTKDIQLYTIDALQIGLLSPSKWNLFYQVGYNFSPLTRGDIISLHNPIDGSFIIMPTLNISLLNNIDFSSIILFTHGKEFSEFGYKSKMIFSRLKYSF